LLGADAFRGLPAWHRWTDLFALAHLVVIDRPGTTLDALPAPLGLHAQQRIVKESQVLWSAPAGAIYFQPVTPQPISASAIRALLAVVPQTRDAKGNELRTLLPAAVLTYIVRNQLYSS